MLMQAGVGVAMAHAPNTIRIQAVLIATSVKELLGKLDLIKEPR
jgi:hypothetical protein